MAEHNDQTPERNDQTLVNFKIDAIVKESAEAVLSGMGLNTSAYLGMCLRKLAQERTLPFDLKLDPEFWIAEAQVSKAVNILRSGFFFDMCALREEIIDDLSEKLVDLIPRIYAARTQNSTNFGSESSDFTVFLCWIQSIGYWIKAASFEELLDFLMKDVDNMQYIFDSDHQEYIDLIEALAEWKSNEIQTIKARITRLGTEKSVLPTISDGKDDDLAILCAQILDEKLDFVVSEYNQHRESFDLRFVGAEAYVSSVESYSTKRAEAKSAAEENSFAKLCKQAIDNRREDYQWFIEQYSQLDNVD